MDRTNYIIKKKFNHLSYQDYRTIESDYNHFFKSKKRSIKTIFMTDLANKVNTCLSNLYKIIKDGLVELYNHDYIKRIEFSADAVWNARQNIVPNNFKAIKCSDFINLIVRRFNRKHNIESIEVIYNDLLINHKDKKI